MSDWPLDITVTRNYSDGLPTISAAGLVEDQFLLLPKRKEELLKWSYRIIGENPPLLQPVGRTSSGKMKWDNGPRERFKWFGERIGYNFHVAWNKTMYREWIGDDNDLIYKLCFGVTGKDQAYTYQTGRYGARHPLGYNPRLLKSYWMARPAILQAEKDGIFNIAPLLMHYPGVTVSPRMLKNYYGNGLWKKLCRQSLTRNKMLARYSVEGCAKAVDIPSTILKIIDPRFIDQVPLAVLKEIERRKKERRLNSISPHDLRGWNYNIYDTERMAQQQRVDFSHEWSLRRILDLHNELIREQQRLYDAEVGRRGIRPVYNAPRRTYGPFTEVCGPGTVNGDDYDIVLLDSAEKIIEEGREMHHCVASYAVDASNGDCSIYSIRDKSGKRLTTLQILKDGRLSQHYGKYNAEPPREVVEFVWKVTGR